MEEIVEIYIDEWRWAGISVHILLSLCNVPGLKCASLGVVWMAVHNQLYLFPLDYMHLFNGNFKLSILA